MESLGAILTLAFSAGVVVTIVATFAARRLAIALRVLDQPDGWRKRQKRAVPLLGGLAVIVGWMASVACASSATGFDLATALPWPLVVSTVFLCFVGTWDDLFGSRVAWKLLAQASATVPLVVSGMTIERINVAGVDLALGALDVPLTVLVYVLAINALNFIDGMDGLCSQCGLFASLAVTAISVHEQAFGGAAGSVAMAGALCGFLVFNLPPAKIYLGDAGSMAMGLVLTWQLVLMGDTTSAGLSPTLFLMLLAVPLADLGLAIFRRTLLGRAVWEADRGHVHHRLLDIGWSVGGTLLVLGSVSFACALGAFSSWVAGAPFAAFAGLVVLFGLLIRYRLVGHEEWDLARKLFVLRWTSRRLRGRASERLAAMTFDETWRLLLAETSQIPLTRVRANFGADPLVREHSWKPGRRSKSNRSFVVQIRVRAAGNAWCQLSFESDAPEVFQREEWTGMVSLYRRLAREMIRKRRPATGLSKDAILAALPLSDAALRRAA